MASTAMVSMVGGPPKGRLAIGRRLATCPTSDGQVLCFQVAPVPFSVTRFYSSATSITSRPLYFPQCGQTRCGSLGSWQLGHCDRLALVSEACVRRAEVRRLECRRFGFGMLLSLQLIQMFQRRPAIIGRSHLARALFLIPVLPA